MFDIFGKLFGNSKQTQRNIDIKNVSDSEVNIFQFENLDITSLLNSQYNNVSIKNSLRENSFSSLISNISYRKKTIKSILTKWGNKIWLNIYGGFDTGKTQLSLLIEKELSFDNILNYNFNGLSDIEFKNHIVLIFGKILSNNHNLELIILDDLPKFGLDENLNVLFLQFITYCKANNIKVLSTSNHKIHSKITKTISGDILELQIPLLVKEEIEEIILTYESDESLKKFSTIIEVISTGYPIYVQIICKYLEKNQWSISHENLMAFISGKPFDELDDETYQKLFSSTQDEDSRELLYRLNIVSGTITTEIIEIISNINPIIHKPFEKLKNLDGTWLQKNNDSTFFISPLIKRLGSKNVLPEARKEINKTLAKNILKKKIISQYEGQSALTYFLIGEAYDDAGVVMTMGLQTYFSNPDIYIGSLFQSLWINEYLPDKMSPLLKLSIRSLQLYICNDLQFKGSEKYNQKGRYFVKNDLEVILQDDLQLIPVEVVGIAYIMLFRYYFQDDDIKRSLMYLKKMVENSFEDLEKADESITAHFWSILDKINNSDDIAIWFETFDYIEKKESDYSKELIHLFSRRLIDNISDTNKENWDKIIKVLDFIIEECEGRNLEILSAYACKSKIFIISDKYKDLNNAELFYDNIKNSYSHPEAVFIIKDEFGRQQFYSGDKEKALITLLEIEDVNIISQTKIDTYITIAKIFGEKDKNIAHTYTNKAFQYAVNKDLKVTKLTLAKLIAEYAISYWFLNDLKSSIYKLSEAYELLIKSYKEIDMFDIENDFNITVLRIGVVLNYIWQILYFERQPLNYDGSLLPQPQRGVLSNSYDPVILKEWYDDEKKYLNMYIFVEMFEYFQDKSMAIKWSNYSFELNKEIKLYTQKHTLRTILGYKIVQNLYQEAIELDNEIKIFEDGLNEEMVNSIESNHLKETFLKKLKESKRLEIDDNYYYISNIIPIIIKELFELLNSKITVQELILSVKEHLHRNYDIFTDKETLKHINYILDKFPTKEEDCKSLLKWFSDLENIKNKEVIQVILYLCCSINAPTQQALTLHLATMIYLERLIIGLSSAIHLFILYPFVFKFWTSRILQTPQDFYFLELWQKNLKRTINVKNKFKVVAMYALICMHLSYRPSDDEEKWMKEYIDYVRRNN